jgi:transposase
MQTSESIERTTIGIDVSDKYSRVCVLDGGGAVVEEGRVATTAPAFRRRFRAAPPARVAIEAGAHSAWISLAPRGGWPRSVRRESATAPPDLRKRQEERSRGRGMAGPRSPARCDAAGAHPSSRQREPGGAGPLTRSRCPRAHADHVRGTVKAFGLRLPRCSTHSFVRQITPSLPANLSPLLAPVLEAIDTISGEIRAYDRHVAALADSSYPETRRLRQVPGVGPVTALTYVLTLEDPQRFPSSRAVGSYLGLRPRQRDSGGDEPQLRITKAGDGAVRRLLVGCAHYILGPFGPDSDLRRWGLRLAERGGKIAKKRAVVAVARKLAVLLHRLWVTGKTYEPLRRSATLANEGAPA